MSHSVNHTDKIALCLLGALWACSGGTDVKPVPVAGLTITPDSVMVLVGWTVRLEARLKDVNGNPLSGHTVTWKTDNPAIATVDGSGVVTGVGLGQTRIIATSEGLSDTAAISGTQVVTLGAGDYVSLARPASSGTIAFPANASASDSAIYLFVPQSATDVEGAATPFLLSGGALPPAFMTQGTAGAGTGAAADLGHRFHDFLRREERSHYPFSAISAAYTAPAPAAALAPPTVGSTRSFKVCGDLSCSALQPVTATAKVVTGHLAIYVDNNAPANGLTQNDLDALAALFDTRLYAVDTTAYGRESDIDNNSVVAVLMTNVVNELVTKQLCHDQGFVAGFFFGADIDPQFASQFNHGEVFYSIVADPDSTLSCAHTVSQLKQLVPVTFIHEFQHMISYNQHVLVRSGVPQVTWLDEGMSHFAEELGGRSFLPGDPASFSTFAISDVANAYSFLDSTGAKYLAFPSQIGSLAERGGAWLFVRYLADQFSRDTSFANVAAFTRTLVQTNLTGGADIANATGVPFETAVERWALANYVSDLPGFTPPPELTYKSWSFRSTYASLHQQLPARFPKVFPLTPPITSGPAVSLGDSLRAGSGWYALAAQTPSAPGFNLTFSGLGGAPLPTALVPRLNVVRIR